MCKQQFDSIENYTMFYKHTSNFKVLSAFFISILLKCCQPSLFNSSIYVKGKFPYWLVIFKKTTGDSLKYLCYFSDILRLGIDNLCRI